MSNPIHDRMARIFFSMLESEGEMPESEDMSFFQNHLASFVKVMNEQAVEALVGQGIEEDYAQFIVGGTAVLNKLWGAQSYNDFIVTEQMAEQL